MRPTIFCPVCSSLNKHSKLVLYQINLTSAVYLCEDRNCTYPKGHEWIQVERSLNEIGSTDDADPKDLDNWLHSLLESSEISASGMTDDSINTDELLSQICGEFENMSDSYGNICSDDFDGDFFDMQLLEKDNGAKGEENPTLDHLSNINSTELLHNKLDNATNEIPEKITNNTNTPIQPDNKNYPISQPKILNFNNGNTNKCNGVNRSTEERKTKVIVNKQPGCNVTKEQILEIVKKLPRTSGKTIVLNLTKGYKFNKTGT